MPPERNDDGPGPYIALPEATGAPRAGIVRIHDAHPGLPRRFYDLFQELMVRPGPLRRSQRELIATVVSSENGCHY